MRPGGVAVALTLICLLLACTPIQAKEPLWTKNVSGEYITGVAISEDGSRVCVGTSMGGISLYDGEGTLLWSQRLKGTMQVEMAPDASLVIAGESESRENDKGALRAYDRDGALLWMRHTGWICGYGVSEDLGRIGVGNREGQLVVYDREGSEEIWEDNLIKRYYTISGVGMSADGRYVAYSMFESTPAIYLLEVDTWGTRTISSFSRKYGSPVHTLKLSGNGTYLLAADGEGSSDTVYLFTNRGVLRWRETVSTLIDMEISSDGAMSVVGSGDGCIRTYDLSGNCSWTSCMEGAVQSLSLTPQGDLVAAGTGSGEIVLLDGNGTAIWTHTPDRFPRASIQEVQLSGLGNAMVAVVNRNEILCFSTDPDPVVVMPTPAPPEDPEPVPDEVDCTPFSITALVRGDMQCRERGYTTAGEALFRVRAPGQSVGGVSPGFSTGERGASRYDGSLIFCFFHPM
ncbi:MAG: PQQ-binding-like beta-propeller repeat protein [Methanolinea sp.]|nr:PQQ-binding-like beta-propeller repeat protein [Methanolinea sp.]